MTPMMYMDSISIYLANDKNTSKKAKGTKSPSKFTKAIKKKAATINNASPKPHPRILSSSPLSIAQFTLLGKRKLMCCLMITIFITWHQMKSPIRSGTRPKRPTPKISLLHMRSTTTTPLFSPIKIPWCKLIRG
ncbi:hypothetical protein DSO57_1002419 [Entomophthora muscae]|uniref:Uncharacterized protein n=1 Tax=Entomophthora muscae TaxID=34485 RepID=A0ACC2SBC6_9FUNG|nr:hypothetical protein DSO57_1002419 [Entomophthora muscae]